MMKGYLGVFLSIISCLCFSSVLLKCLCSDGCLCGLLLAGGNKRAFLEIGELLLSRTKRSQTKFEIIQKYVL